MKNLLVAALTILTSITFSFAQSEEANIKKAIENFKKIQEWIKTDDAESLSNHIVYPFKRNEDSPSISDATAFKQYYSTLFDAKMKEKFMNMTFEKWRFLSQNNGNIGFELGQVWLTPNGKIQSIHFISNKEKASIESKEETIKSQIHSDVSSWKENLAYIENHKFIIRVEYLGDYQYRYVSWSKPKTISDKPDLILVRDYVKDVKSNGNTHYSFTNGIWTYRVNNVVYSSSDTIYGWSISILKNGKKAAQYKCEEVK